MIQGLGNETETLGFRPQWFISMVEDLLLWSVHHQWVLGMMDTSPARWLGDAGGGKRFLSNSSKASQSVSIIFRSFDGMGRRRWSTWFDFHVCQTTWLPALLCVLVPYLPDTRHHLQSTMFEPLGAHGPPERFGSPWQWHSHLEHVVGRGSAIRFQPKPSLVHSGHATCCSAHGCISKTRTNGLFAFSISDISPILLHGLRYFMFSYAVALLI